LGLLGGIGTFIALPSRGSATTPPPLGSAQINEGFEALKRLRLVSAAGDKFSLANYAGRGLLINIWANWCPNCVAEFDSMRALQHSVGGESKLAIVLISLPENWEKDRIFAPQHGITFPMFEAIYKNHTSEANDMNTMLLTYDDNGVTRNGMPQTYIVAPDGSIITVLRGGINWMSPQIRSATENLLHF
jgi:thiol-disulfide isomerase/thioredoxin